MDPASLMTLHYHGTPITPLSALDQLAGRCFCVSHARPDQIKHCLRMGQSVMLDNGAFSKWRLNKPTDWPAYYAWTERYLVSPTTWAVIPDVIDAGEEAQDYLLVQWPHGATRAAPVWHMDEHIDRLLTLLDSYPRVCIGSTSVYAQVLSPAWQIRMDDAWDAIALRHQRLPWVHMLRGMQCVDQRWPFASVDSTDVARNHSRKKNPRAMLDRWDVVQCPDRWDYRFEFYESNWT